METRKKWENIRQWKTNQKKINKRRVGQRKVVA